jgi:hypothetical protein
MNYGRSAFAGGAVQTDAEPAPVDPAREKFAAKQREQVAESKRLKAERESPEYKRAQAEARAAERLETETRRAYLVAGGSREAWEKEKPELLKQARAEATEREWDAARSEQARLYRGF